MRHSEVPEARRDHRSYHKHSSSEAAERGNASPGNSGISWHTSSGKRHQSADTHSSSGKRRHYDSSSQDEELVMTTHDGQIVRLKPTGKGNLELA